MTHNVAIIQPVSHSLQRKKALALARPCDSAGEFTATFEAGFDLSRSIFKTLPKNSVKSLVQKTKLDARLMWHVASAVAIERAYACTGPAPSIADDTPLHTFMLAECDFSTEHADGSFMDHLHFCRE